MSSMFGDVLGSVLSSVLSGQQGGQPAPGAQGGLGGMLGGVLGGMMGGGQQAGGGLGGVLGSMLGAGQHGQPGQAGGQPGGLGGMLGGLGGLGGNGALLAALLPVAFQMIQSQGGLSGLAAKFQNAGMGEQVKSWVGTGANQAISGANVVQAVGGDAIAQMAKQLGLSQDKVSGGLAEVLPEIVNQMTPHGSVPDNHHQMLDQGLAALTKMLG
ncbi:MAG: DUF937 domain-containing protein [Betaproteobacteria bacterium]|nr:DUF937 domain-containing protein [Betaproteobacteria bacterium]